MPDKKTALYEKHLDHKAKMVSFAGYLMPIQYSGILDEHLAVRNKVGVFDVSHMGEFEINGSDAASALNYITTNNVTRLEVGDIQYSAMLYEDGGVVDDLLVYRFEDRFMAVVNAANIDKDFDWMEQNLSGDVNLKNVSDEITLLAVQGPDALKVVRKLTDTDLDAIKYYNFRNGKVAGCDTVISRTGYTGENGFELYVQPTDAETLWDALFDAGDEFGIQPVGLGARDSLRLEVNYCLYGNDIDQTTNPIEAGLSWIVKSKKKGGFIGKEPVLAAKNSVTRKLVGFVINDKGIARQHSDIFCNGSKVGQVTSGGFSPILKKPVGMAFIDKPYDTAGTEIEIEMRGRRIAAQITETPFYSRS